MVHRARRGYCDAMLKYLKHGVSHAAGGLLNLILDSPLFYNPPLQWLKAKILNSLYGARISPQTILKSGVRAIAWDNVQIEAYAYLSDDVTVHARAPVFVGAGTTISPEVFIGSGGHNPADLAVEATPVRIGRCVFVGARAVILPGVTIGDHAVIGAGAVVVNDVPSCAVCVGVPAKVVRHKEEPEEIWTVFGRKKVEEIFRGAVDEGFDS